MVAGPVKQTDYPQEDARTVPFEMEKNERAAPVEGDAPPRYLDVPARPAPAGGGRNLALGVTFLVLAVIGLWLGRYIAGAAVIRTLVASLGAFGILLLMMNCRVLGQKNGLLLGLGATALFGAAIPFVEGAFRKLDDMAKQSLGGGQPVALTSTPPPPPPTTETAPPAPPTPESGGARVSDEGAGLAEKPTLDDGPPRELLLPPPAPDAGKLVRLNEDVKVPLDGRMTILRKGTLAPFKSLEDGKVTFFVNGSEVSIDSELVTFTGATRERPQDITALAQAEVARRYPKVAEPDSRENILFVTRAKEIGMDREMSAVFFADPKWPIVLAEQIAGQEGWIRADIAADEQPMPEDAAPPVGAIPANQLPADPDDPGGAQPEADAPAQQNPPPPPAR